MSQIATGYTVDRERLAWAAGFFDGEGCASFYENAKKPRFQLQASQCEAWPLERLKDLFGGYVNGPYAQKRPNHRPQWRYTLDGLEVVQAAIAMMWPWLGPIKRRQYTSALQKCLRWSGVMPPISALDTYKYYEDQHCILYHGDNMAILPLLAESSIDIAMTSPPYNTAVVGNGNLKPSGFRREPAMAQNLAKMTSGYSDALDEQEYQMHQLAMMDMVHRVLLPGGSFFLNHKIRWRDKVMIHPYDWIRYSPFNIRMEIVWDRGVGLTLNARRFYDQDERIYWLHKGDQFRWNQEAVGLGSVWRIPPTAFKNHACVFPENLVGHCLSGVARAGDTVLDPYAGSGTVAVVARKFGCKAILIEAEERYCEVIVERLSQQVLPMFDNPEETTLV